MIVITYSKALQVYLIKESENSDKYEIHCGKKKPFYLIGSLNFAKKFFDRICEEKRKK